VKTVRHYFFGGVVCRVSPSDWRLCATVFCVCVCVFGDSGKTPWSLPIDRRCTAHAQLTLWQQTPVDGCCTCRPVLPVIIVSPRQKSRQLCRSHDTTFGCSARVLSKPKKGLQLDRVNEHLDKGKTPLFQNNIKIQYPVFLMGGNEKGSCPLRRDKRD
jgi:hypothetical protein